MVLAFIADQTGQACLSCFDDELSSVRLVEVMNRGAKFPMSVGGRKKKARKKASPNQRAAEHAQRSAWRRLAAIHPEMYEMLYDEERARRGLNPIVRRDRRDRREVVMETLAFDQVYAALHLSGESDA